MYQCCLFATFHFNHDSETQTSISALSFALNGLFIIFGKHFCT